VDSRARLGLTAEIPRPRRTSWVFDGKGIREIEIDKG
jgi:hypothetical protein